MVERVLRGFMPCGLKESSGLYKEEAAGPFFFEIIQRKGDQGFGAPLEMPHSR